MDFLDWRILIGVAILAAGWMLGRVDMEQVVAGARSVPAKVSEGIAKLLRNDKQAAAAAFLAAALPVERANLELHFIAGALYRDSGDNEAAIRVHKRLMSTSALQPSDHARVRYELGLDYQCAGFIDLAEECFSQLRGTEQADASLRHLFNLHLYSRDWEAAIEDEERFGDHDGTKELRRHILAQLYCEWAAGEEPPRRAELLEQALLRNPSCGRAKLMQAEQALAAGDASQALAALEVVHGQPALMPLAASLLFAAHRAAGDQAAGEQALLDAFAQRPSLLLFDKVYAALAEERGPEGLGELAALGLRQLRGTLPVSRWLETRRRAATGQEREDYEALYAALGPQHARYRCRECDFKSRSHYWQCPACRKWETMLDKGGELA